MTFREKLTVNLWILDAVITGGDPRSGRGDPDLMVEEDWVAGGREYYLSDGGYSRVCLDTGTRKLFLTSNSTDRAKERWESHQAFWAKRRIEDLIREHDATQGKVWQ